MHEITIKSTFPPTISGIQDLQGMPILQSDKDVENRILNFFRGTFGQQRAALKFIGTNAKEVKKYEKDFLGMVYGKDAKYPLVAFDGYADDKEGKDDIAIYLDMGIPRLRARNVNYLDRIYVKIRKNSYQSNPMIRFYCCPEGFDIRKIYAGWHPHISESKPCLGGFESNLYDCYDSGDWINYLDSVHRFLNTWNRESPYWDINHNVVTYRTDKYEFKGSIMKWAKESYLTGRISNWFTENDIIHHLKYIKSDSLPYALKFICDNIAKCFEIFQDFNENISNALGQELTENIERIDNEYLYSKETGKYSFSVFPSRIEDTYTRMRTLYSHTWVNNGSKTTTLVPNSDSISFKTMVNLCQDYDSEEVFDMRETIFCLQKVISEMYRIIKGNSFLYKVIDIKAIIKESIVSESRFVEPVKVEQREFYNMLEKKGNRATRATETSSYSGQTEKSHDILIQKSISRSSFVRKRLYSICKESLTDKSINECINKKMKEMFVYDTKHRYNIGTFWARRNLLPSQEHTGVKERRLEILKQIGGLPKSLEDLLNKYNELNQQYLLIENNILKDYYSKIVRRLDKNEFKMQIDNTSISPEQVQLSFD
jgi:archaellum component FlaC